MSWIIIVLAAWVVAHVWIQVKRPALHWVLFNLTGRILGVMFALTALIAGGYAVSRAPLFAADAAAAAAAALLASTFLLTRPPYRPDLRAGDSVIAYFFSTWTRMNGRRSGSQRGGYRWWWTGSRAGRGRPIHKIL